MTTTPEEKKAAGTIKEAKGNCQKVQPPKRGTNWRRVTSTSPAGEERNERKKSQSEFESSGQKRGLKKRWKDAFRTRETVAGRITARRTKGGGDGRKPPAFNGYRKEESFISGTSTKAEPQRIQQKERRERAQDSLGVKVKRRPGMSRKQKAEPALRSRWADSGEEGEGKIFKGKHGPIGFSNDQYHVYYEHCSTRKGEYFLRKSLRKKSHCAEPRILHSETGGQLNLAGETGECKCSKNGAVVEASGRRWGNRCRRGQSSS